MSGSTHHFFINNLGACCKTNIEVALRQQKNVASVAISIEGHVIITATKRKTIDEELLKSTVVKLGYELEPIPTIPSYWPKGLLAGAAGLTLFILGACGIVIPMLAMYFVAPACGLILLYVGYDVYCRGLKEIRELVETAFAFILFYDNYKEICKKAIKSLTMNSLLTVSTLLLLGLSIASLCMPTLGLPLFFDAALMIFLFYFVGKIIQAHTNKIVSGSNLLKLAAKKIKRIVNKDEYYAKNMQKDFAVSTEEVLSSELKIDDIILVEKNDIIPVDGECIQFTDDAEVFDYMTVGRTLDELKVQQPLLAGVEVTDGTLYLKVTKTKEASKLARLYREIKATAIGKTQFETTISDNAVLFYIPTIFLLALAAGLCVGFLYTPLLGLQAAACLLGAICTCQLLIIAPLAVKAEQKKAIKTGLIINHGKALEIAAKAKIFYFDLNGALTEDMPSVAEISDSKILEYFYILENEHRIGKTICSYIRDQHPEATESKLVTVAIPEETKQDKARVEKIIDGQYYAVGDSSRICKYGVSPEALEHYQKEKFSSEPQGQVIFLTRGTKNQKDIIGHVVLKYKLRPDAIELFQKLRAEEIECRIFTGSDKAHAYPMARELGIAEENLHEHVKTDCSDDDESTDASKQSYVTDLENQGYCVAVVVDQLNDTRAMNSKDPSANRLSIAVNSAHPEIKNQAQAVLATPSLLSILTLIQLSRQFIRHVKQNLALNFICNIAAVAVPLVLLFTIGFVLNPAWAAGLIVLQALVVLLCVCWFYYQPLAIDATKIKTNKQSLDEQIPKNTSNPLPSIKLTAALAQRSTLSSPEQKFVAPYWHSRAHGYNRLRKRGDLLSRHPRERGDLLTRSDSHEIPACAGKTV